MPNKKPVRPARTCGECDHYYACSAHTNGHLWGTDATHCANFANVTAHQREVERLRLLLDEAELELAKAEPVQKWISVKDRLPEKGETVLVVADRGIDFAYFGSDGWDLYTTELWPVTHWMPLPEPPKEAAT